MAEVLITITGEDRATTTFRAVEESSKNAAGGIDQFESATKKANSTALEFVKGLGAWDVIKSVATKIKDLIVDSTQLSARVETLGIVMHQVGSNAGYTAAETDKYAESVKAMGITTQESKSSITKMMQAHIDLSKATDLARIAQDAAVIANTNSSEAMDRLIYGIQSGQVEVLRTMGINVNFENSYKSLGAQLGKNAIDLTELEKTQARTNVVMEAGSTIAGSYEAAMGTVGKQLTSMPRYAEEAMLTFGNIFKDAFQDVVVGANTMLQDIKKYIDQHGEDIKAGVAVVWKTVSVAIGVVVVVAKAAADALTGILTVLGKIDKAIGTIKPVYALSGILTVLWSIDKAAAAIIAKIRPAYAELKESEEWIAENQKYIIDGLEERKNKHKEAATAAVEDTKASEAAVQAGMKSLQDLSSIIATIGSQDLKFGGEAFTQGLKDQQQSITGMQTALEGYLGTVENVYGRQIALQKEVTDAMKTGGANPAELAKAQAEAFNTEIALAAARLAAWKQYYGALLNAHSAVMDKMKQKTEELNKIEVDRAVQWNNYADIQNGLRQKLMTGEEKYYDQLGILSQKYNVALALEGEAKIKALEDWQKARASMASAVTEGDNVIISQEKAVATAMADIAKAQTEIGNAYDQVQAKRQAEIEQLGAWQVEIETAMAKAAEMIGLYQQQITSLDEQLAAQRVLSVDVEAAKTGVQMIKDFILSDLDPAVQKDRKLAIDPAPAIAAAGAVQAAIDSIPDVSYKKVVVAYEYTGSPSMPFTEGIDYVKEKMASIPTEGNYKLNFNGFTKSADGINDIMMRIAETQGTIAANRRVGGPESSRLIDRDTASLESLENSLKMLTSGGGGGGGAKQITANFNISLQVDGAGKSDEQLLTVVDTGLADRFRRDASKLKKEIEAL